MAERVNKLWYIHIMEHYSAIKKNAYASYHMDEAQSNYNQTQKITYYSIYIKYPEYVIP